MIIKKKPFVCFLTVKVIKGKNLFQFRQMFLEQFDIIGIGTDLIKPSSFVWRPMAFILNVNVSEKCRMLNEIMEGKPENRQTGKPEKILEIFILIQMMFRIERETSVI
jgi:hypothetical protein